jgi:hypothetical protein
MYEVALVIALLLQTAAIAFLAFGLENIHEDIAEECYRLNNEVNRLRKRLDDIDEQERNLLTMFAPHVK